MTRNWEPSWWPPPPPTPRCCHCSPRSLLCTSPPGSHMEFLITHIIEIRKWHRTLWLGLTKHVTELYVTEWCHHTNCSHTSPPVSRPTRSWDINKFWLLPTPTLTCCDVLWEICYHSLNVFSQSSSYCHIKGSQAIRSQVLRWDWAVLCNSHTADRGIYLPFFLVSCNK